MIRVQFFSYGGYLKYAPHDSPKHDQQSAVCIVRSYIRTVSVRLAIGKFCQENKAILLALPPTYPHAFDFLVHTFDGDKQFNKHVIVAVVDGSFDLKNMVIQDYEIPAYEEFVDGLQKYIAKMI